METLDNEIKSVPSYVKKGKNTLNVGCQGLTSVQDICPLKYQPERAQSKKKATKRLWIILACHEVDFILRQTVRRTESRNIIQMEKNINKITSQDS